MDRADQGQGGAKAVGCLVAVLVLVAYATLQLGSLGHPLFWQDEGETVMFGQRILDYGYPKVHADGNVVYGMGIPLELGVDADRDAYMGSLWGQYYLAAFAVWLAQDETDLYRQTAQVRLPFALLGILGLVMFFLSARPALGGGRWGLAGAAAAYALLLCLSTSLILHLREVRYYAPALFLLAAVVWLQSNRPPGRKESGAGRALAMACALLLLFNFFHPAAMAATLWVCVEWLVWARRSSEPLAASIRRARSFWFAMMAFVGLALAIASSFGLPALSQVLSQRWGFGPGLYLENLQSLLGYLLRYEFLGPLLVVEAALFLARSRVGAGGEDTPSRAMRGSLLRLVVIYGLVGAANPIFFERYFVPLGPLIALVLLIDLEILWRALGRFAAAGKLRSRAAILAGSCVAMLAVIMAIRAPELKGRVDEIRRPVEGPVDAAIEFIRARYPDPSTLLIATNYEAEAFMYYLGSRVVGRFHAGSPAAIAAEAALRPDLVIPRSAQPRSHGAVRRYLLAGRFERHALHVSDTEYNNIPELSPGRLLSTTHRFSSSRPGEDGPPLAIYERRPEP
ncbi:MAG: hypothetical protein NZ990_13595 [Myxococcota bacterium]|nr:hypothetical protein [Myxococcota bacterium]